MTRLRPSLEQLGPELEVRVTGCPFSTRRNLPCQVPICGCRHGIAPQPFARALWREIRLGFFRIDGQQDGSALHLPSRSDVAGRG